MSNGDKILSVEALYDIPVQLSVVLGGTRMSLSDLLKISKGSVIELDSKVGEPVDIYVNNTMIGKGEIVIVENNVGVAVVSLIDKEKGQLVTSVSYNKVF